jgi:hypothetical protein
VETLRREIYEEPEEIHLGGALDKKSKFSREMDQIEKLEQEHFKRMSFSKKEMNKIREDGKL